ncbi:trypsin-like peptidase domain-containing protein [Pseudenhygromyxa sp. WMMC2535]|uniref:trypsin-like serine peptidase n=1 Tax=Pseudenhygromyxa sp. WMMC2535 TaxID=2712867 RepID=UPI001C3D838F|nr:trypsin-like peptidase domain-containing protein [Pseudenhygromyxa sp. WMMC2535]
MCGEPRGDDEVGVVGEGVSQDRDGPEPIEFVEYQVDDVLAVEVLAQEPRSWENEDPRWPVTSESTLQEYPLRTVVQTRLAYPTPGGDLSIIRGSGFLAGPRHVITNRHTAVAPGVNVNEMIEDEPALFDFSVFPGRSNVAILNGGDWRVERVLYNPYPVTEYDDYAILVLEDDPERSGQYGRMGVCEFSKGTLDGLWVSSAGFPGADQDCEHTPDDPIPGVSDCPCGGWMYLQSCWVEDVDPQELTLSCVVQSGQSGSPVWFDGCGSDETRCTVGILYGSTGLSTGAVRWEDEDVEWLRSNICAWPSQYAVMPSFC